MIAMPFPGGNHLLVEVTIEFLQKSVAGFWPGPPPNELVLLVIALAAMALLAVSWTSF